MAKDMTQRLLRRFAKSWDVVFLLAVSIAIRFYIFKVMHPVIHTDSITFLFLEEVDMVRTPGYPLFIELLLSLNDLLSLSSNYYKVICFGQLFLLGVLNAYLIYRIAKYFSGNRIFALAMGIVYNFNFFVVGFEIQILTETLSITLLLAVILLALPLFEGKKSRALLAGGLFVLLFLTKATYFLLGIVLPFLALVAYYPLSKKKKFLKTAAPVLSLFLAVTIAGIAGWSLRNKVKFDYFGVSNLMPYQLRYYTNSLFEKYKPGKDEKVNRVAAIYAEELKKTGGASVTVFNFHQRLYEEMGLSDAAISRLFMKAQMKLIRDYPMEYLRQVPSSLDSYYRQYSAYWTAGNSRKFLGSGHIFSKIFKALFTLYEKLFTNTLLLLLTVAAAPLALFFMVFKERRLRHGWLLLEVFIQYNCFVSVLSTNAGVNNLRYRQPVEPLLLLVFYLALFLAGKKIYLFFKRPRTHKKG